jgi:hypothetical protein
MTMSTSGGGVAGEQRRQVQRGGGFQRADGQRAAWCSVIPSGSGGVGEEAGEAAGVGEEAFAGRGQGDAAAVALEQCAAQLLFQAADAGGDIGLHGVQFGGGAVHTACAGDGLEDLEFGGFHGASCVRYRLWRLLLSQAIV